MLLRRFDRKLAFIFVLAGAGCYGGNSHHNDNGGTDACQAVITKLQGCNLVQSTGSGTANCGAQTPSACESQCVAQSTCAELTSLFCELQPSTAFNSCLTNCENKLTQCPDNSGSYTADEKCDGFNDCANGSDETACPTFSCGNTGTKVLARNRCDGHSDCPNGEDELNCGTSGLSLTCPVGSGGSAGTAGSAGKAGSAGAGGSAGISSGGYAGTIVTAGTGGVSADEAGCACGGNAGTAAGGYAGYSGAAGTAGTGGATVGGPMESCNKITAAVAACGDSGYVPCNPSSTTYGSCYADCIAGAACGNIMNHICNGYDSAIATCESNCFTTAYFHCGDVSDSQVPEYYLCDGFQDCSNNADETGCPPQYFTCPDQSTIPMSWRCDGFQDCF